MDSITQIIADAATSAGIPISLALAQAKRESSLNPNAYNPRSGATGLFQLEPATAAGLGVTSPTDPAQNAQGGTSYLAQLYNRFGDWAAALAAYDWGQGNVQDAQAAHGANWLAYAPSETRNYVAALLPYTTAPSSLEVSAGAPSPGPDLTSMVDDVLTPALAPSTGSGVNVLLIGALAFAAWIAFGFLEGEFSL